MGLPEPESPVRMGYPSTTITTTSMAPATHQASVAFVWDPEALAPPASPCGALAPPPPPFAFPPPFPPPETRFPQFVQNLLPGGTPAPQDGHVFAFKGVPQLEQNLPEASAPQDGHFIDQSLPANALKRRGQVVTVWAL